VRELRAHEERLDAAGAEEGERREEVEEPDPLVVDGREPADEAGPLLPDPVEAADALAGAGGEDLDRYLRLSR
jgi:hypothetical protein